MSSFNVSSLLSSGSSSSTTSTALATAQAALRKRYLKQMGDAIESGDLSSAKSALKSAIKAFGGSTSSTTSKSDSSSKDSDSGSAINKDFDAISTALDSNDTAAAKSGWTQLKTDLSDAGLTNLDDSSTMMAQAMASLNEQNQTSLIKALFGDNSSDTSSSSDISSILSNWMTYKENGIAAKAQATKNSGTTLNTSA
jgi:hypothetical protein